MKFQSCVVVTIMFSACVSKQQQLDCSAVKTGKFRFHRNNNVDAYLIERNATVQSETNVRTGSITTLSITWTSPCEYELRFLSRKNAPGDTLQEDLGNVVLRTRINAVYPDHYVFTSTEGAFESGWTDSLEILKE